MRRPPLTYKVFSLSFGAGQDLTIANEDIGSFARWLLSVVDWPEADPDPNAPLESLGNWNSLAILQVAVAFDERYGLDLSAQRIAECRTLADLHGLLKAR